MKKRFTKTAKIAVLLFLLSFSSFNIFAQSVANYVFTTNTAGSLVLDKNANPIDMSTGTTTLIGPSINTFNTPLLDIGFDFTYNAVRANKYSVTAHGLIGLYSNTGISLTTPNNIGGTNSNRLGALVMATAGTNMGTHATGKVHSKIIGTFPNRILVIEWLNMSIPSASTSADATFQARLYEAGSTIEYVYGNMAYNNITTAITAVKCGISTSSTAGAANTVDFTSNPPVGNTTTATGFSNSLAIGTGNITTLNSAANGSRRVFAFNPPTVAAPTALTFSPVGAGSMTINWTDNATNELSYLVYRSDDGGTTFSFAANLPSNTTSYAAVGLAASTNYFWRVAAYAEGRSDYLTGNASTTGVGSTITSTSTGGLWSQTTTWVGGTVPNGDNEVVIANGSTVTIDINANAYNLTVGQGASGSLIFETTTVRTLSIANNLTINAFGTLATPATGTVTTHVVNVFNNVTNNGTLDLSTNTNTAGAELRFSGLSNASYSGVGTTNDMFLLTVNKNVPSGIVSTSSPTVDISLSAMTGKGAASAFVNSTSVLGILKFSGTNTLINVLFSPAGYTIPITGGLWINNPNMTVSGQASSATWNGLLRISAGTFNCGTGTGNQMAGGAGATYIFEGGTTNFSGRLLNASAITFTMTGGIINVCTVGNSSSSAASFSLTSTSNIVTISGGVINMVKPSTGATKVDYNLAGNLTITGGTLNLNGTAASTYNIAGNTPNVIVSNTCTARLTALVNIYGDLSIASGSSFDATTFSIFAFGQSVAKPGNIINDGTIINSATTTVGSNRLGFNGTFGGQTVSGSGTVGSSASPISALSLANEVGVTFSQSVLTSRINLFAGTITNANNITLGNSYATPFTAIIQIGGTATGAQGSMGSSAPTFNVVTSGLSILYSVGTNSVTTGTEIPPSRTLTSLTINTTAPASVTLDGGDLAVTGTLTFTTGNLFLGANSITAAAITGGSATSHAITNGAGYLKATVSTAPITFPMGASATMYDPVVLTENGGTPNTYGVKVTNGAVINNPSDATKTVNKNWEISKFLGAASNVNATLTYDAATTLGANFNPSGAIVVGHWNSMTSKWEEFAATLATNTVTINGITSFSPFAVANAGALPIELLSFTGKKVEKAVQLDWATASESNNAKFEVERGNDGENFQRIVTKLGNGDKKTSSNYTYKDVSAPNAVLYYRLKQMDNDGRFAYSPIISVNNQNSKDAIALYPNPVKEVLYFTTENQEQPIYIYNFNGALVKKMDNVPSYLSIDDLQNGIYMLKTNSQTINFVKE